MLWKKTYTKRQMTLIKSGQSVYTMQKDQNNSYNIYKNKNKLNIYIHIVYLDR